MTGCHLLTTVILTIRQVCTVTLLEELLYSASQAHTLGPFNRGSLFKSIELNVILTNAAKCQKMIEQRHEKSILSPSISKNRLVH